MVVHANHALLSNLKSRTANLIITPCVRQCRFVSLQYLLSTVVVEVPCNSPFPSLSIYMEVENGLVACFC